MVVTIPCLRRSPRWTAKRSISAALLVTLVLIAITASFSIILAPAHISVVVKEAAITTYYFENNTDRRIRTTHLRFTLVATNNSSRTEVRYGHPMNAEIWYGPTEIAWLRASALLSSDDFDEGSATVSKKWHPPGSDACFHFAANYGYDSQHNAPNDNLVVVQATVWFRYGLATTLPFTVKFACQHVNFVNGINFPIKCDA